MIHGVLKDLDCRFIYGTSDPDRGCLGFSAIWNANSLIRIPDRLGSGKTAALICGGATARTVLSRYGMKPGDHVGVIGIGGMGHLAIKMINKGLWIQGSLVASRGDIAKMLQFCAEKRAEPATSKFSLSSTEEVDQAMDGLQRNTVRYEALLVADKNAGKL
ncbi:hypothetical protein ASPBRDRAFT_32006 [Aspergillus brasiliensis CBS 101740]|uniref:Alcohol dehydrogenase-like C-terminal domain-containing protein n=1 Tax=Aspergillus brasiliensis (strain CBS 101740 / IMI 381727 / IBT 21946) TaxID=767769 RepID=A0A1L9UEP5_ASPBC|nr:hypothetical protein ASPBRDRAFT_32006 [Aspergillus brasiliensis CBS 101740]